MPVTNKHNIPPAVSTRNKVGLIRGGRDYFSKLTEMIEKAGHCIHLQSYILEEDDTGHLVANALKAAAARKVDTYIMVDGYASRSLSREFIRGLKNAGVKFRFFSPLFSSRYFYFGRRLHHKIVVVDGSRALAGGINIGDRYNDRPGIPAWLDFAIYVEGEAAEQLCILCWKTWNNFPLTQQDYGCRPVISPVPANANCRIMLRRNDWVRRKNEISSSYIQMLRHAKQEVTILCSYFLPGKVFRKHLSEAIARGVHVRIVMAGTSDIKWAKYAERYLYDWLLRNNIEFFEYMPAVLHGKLAICDSEWATVGSYNINDISAYASIELNLDIINPEFARHTLDIVNHIIKTDCTPITAEYHHRSTNPLRMIFQWLSYESIRLIFQLFTFYFKHQK